MADLSEGPGVGYVSFDLGPECGKLLVDPRCTKCARYASFKHATAHFEHDKGGVVEGARCSRCGEFDPCVWGFF